MAITPKDVEAQCGFNDTHDPSARAHHPVVGVDGCDARAYCDWAGKRLCLAALNTVQTEPSEWKFACRANSAEAFPYGDAYDPSACSGKDYGANKLLPVGSLASCEGGLSGLFDMSGNAREWLGVCESEQSDAKCRHGSGHYKEVEAWLACEPPGPVTGVRSLTFSDLGFRCCAEALP